MITQYAERSSGTPLTLEARVSIPTQLVIGWTQAEKVTDIQIDALLNSLGTLAKDYANEFWTQYNRILSGLPTDYSDKLQDMRTIVREWLANL